MSREYEGTKSRTGFYRKADEKRKVLSEYFKENILYKINPNMQRRSWARTYWVQGAGEFLAGFYWKALRNALYAIVHDPLSLFNELPKAVRLLKECLLRKLEAKDVP